MSLMIFDMFSLIVLYYHGICKGLARIFSFLLARSLLALLMNDDVQSFPHIVHLLALGINFVAVKLVLLHILATLFLGEVFWCLEIGLFSGVNSSSDHCFLERCLLVVLVKETVPHFADEWMDGWVTNYRL
jgi:hypothetical protein